MEVGDREPTLSYDYWKSVGFQATELGRTIEVIKKMFDRENISIFFSFTANMVASGVRYVIKEFLRRKWVDVVITTPGALEHDFIKSFHPYYIGSFYEDDKELNRQGRNRIGNILVPNDRYVFFEEKMNIIFSQLYESQKVVSPYSIAKAMGKYLFENNREDSFLYWAYKNEIPVFCPGITDGAIGLNAFFFKQKYKDFGIDVTKDMELLSSIVLNADETGGIVLGGGISKHHLIGVNLVRGGLDYAVYITTSVEWDGSLSGAKPSEAVSWGKIKSKARVSYLYSDVTIALPLIYLILTQEKIDRKLSRNKN